jgi:hypothetical protein
LRTAPELKQRPLLFAEIPERLLSAVERNAELLSRIIVKALN